MAELALQKYNVAIPEVDIGDDVFVLNDRTKESARIQVRTAVGRQDRRGRYLCRFPVKHAHLKKQMGHGHYYVFAGRCGNEWRFVIVSTSKLEWLTFHRTPRRLGAMRKSKTEVHVPIYFRSDGKAKSAIGAKAINLTKYLNRWCLDMGRA